MIGAPVTSVRTPPLLEAFLAGRSVPAEITVRHLELEDLPAFMDEVAADRSIDGLLVTMPHKKVVMPHLMTSSPRARQAKSVNAVKRDAAGVLVGAQFDGIGLVNALLARKVDLGKTRVLLAGVGGAGLAIVHALAAHGCARLDLVDPDRAALDQALEALPGRYAVPVSDAVGGPGSYDLLINATPLGMKADDPSPFAAALVASAGAVADIVVDPNQTQLAALARGAGCVLITGRQMVEGQIAPIGRWLLADDLDET